MQPRLVSNLAILLHSLWVLGLQLFTTLHGWPGLRLCLQDSFTASRTSWEELPWPLLGAVAVPQIDWLGPLPHVSHWVYLMTFTALGFSLCLLLLCTGLCVCLLLNSWTSFSISMTWSLALPHLCWLWALASFRLSLSGCLEACYCWQTSVWLIFMLMV